MRNHRCLVYLNDVREFKALTERQTGVEEVQGTPVATNSATAVPLRTLAQASHSQRALQEVLTLSAHSQPVNKRATATAGVDAAGPSSIGGVAPSDATTSSSAAALFSGPSHLLPSLTSLFGHLMDEVLRKHPIRQGEDGATRGASTPSALMEVDGTGDSTFTPSRGAQAEAVSSPGGAALSSLRQDDFVFPSMLRTLQHNLQHNRPMDTVVRPTSTTGLYRRHNLPPHEGLWP